LTQRGIKMSVLEPSKLADEYAYVVIGAAIEVHRILGTGHLEAIYEEALCKELCLRNIPFIRQKPFAVQYKGVMIGQSKVDLIVGDCLVVELKTADSISQVHVSQVLSYLKITGYHLGLLLNFHSGIMKNGIKRVVLAQPGAPSSAT